MNPTVKGWLCTAKDSIQPLNSSSGILQKTHSVSLFLESERQWNINIIALHSLYRNAHDLTRRAGDSDLIAL
jgi:hypothetical protein